MRVIICKDYSEVSQKTAQLIASQITLKPNCTLGLIAEDIAIGAYYRLSQMDLDLSEVSTFNITEVYPKSDDTKSCLEFMKDNLFKLININKDNIHFPDSNALNAEAECLKYDLSVKNADGIDLQLLSIDGAFSSDISENTIGMSQSTVLKSKKIVVLASGAKHNKIVEHLLNNKVNSDSPLAMLKLHSDVVLICDKDAYSGVKTKLGVDIGGTDVKFAVVEDKKLKYKSVIPTDCSSAEKLVSDIVNECNRIRETYYYNSVGVATPGLNNDNKITAVNLPFKDYPLADELQKKLNLHVTVDNDGNCAALGEALFGGKGYDNIVMVTLGTGVGGGIIMKKKICHGRYSMGEVGHIIVEATNGLPCTCGMTGCWEQYASVTALVRESVKAAKENPESILYEKYSQNGKLNGRLIFAALDEGCPVAREVFEAYIKWVAVGIKSLINIFGPDAIILAGGITARGETIIAELKKHIQSKTKIEISNLQNDAGGIGAAML